MGLPSSPFVSHMWAASSHTPTSHIRSWQNKMSGHAEQCVLKYLELAKIGRDTLKKVTTPCIDDHHICPEDHENPGVLSPVASKIVLKVLFLARMVRIDLLWTVNLLAREVTKWTVACEKR